MGCQLSNQTELPPHDVPLTSSVVWLVCEDQSLFMPMYGDSLAHMPNVQSLAEEGTTFDHFFSVAPVCAPSRSSILTGLQPSFLGTHHMRAYQKTESEVNKHTGLPLYSAPAPEGVKAFSEHLRMQGVYCTNNAKEDYNFLTPPLAWDATSKDAHWRNRPQGSPFFSVFNFNVSHESQIWKRADIPCDISPDDVVVPPLLPEDDKVRADLATNYCNLQELDRQIGQVLTQLKEDGLYEQTTVVFYSDHGGPFPRFKRALSDAGLRVPLIIKWGHSAEEPSHNPNMYSFLDLAPSVLAWMGLTPPKTMSGIPITPNGKGHMEVYGASDRFDEQLDRRRTIRTAKWRLVRNDFPEKPKGLELAYRKRMNTTLIIDSLAENGIEPWHTWKRGRREAFELYHTSEDPWELNDLSNEAAYADTLIALKQKLELTFSKELDLGLLEEATLISMFEKHTGQHELKQATLVELDEGLAVMHENPNVSLGWRSFGEQTWHITSNGKVIIPPRDADALELLAARIGWPTQQTTTKIQRQPIVEVNLKDSMSQSRPTAPQ